MSALPHVVFMCADGAVDSVAAAMVPLLDPLYAAGGQHGAAWVPGTFTNEAGDVMLTYMSMSPIGTGGEDETT